jgi:hypothetical protein
MLEIVKTNPNEPYRIFPYSEGGMGKSTFGAFAERPVVVAAEKGASRLRNRQGQPVDVIRGIDKYQDVVDALKMLRNDKHDFKTAVIDSATEIERMAHQLIIGDSGKSIITVNKGFGAGASESDSMHKELIVLVEDLRINRDMNIIVTGHAQTKKVPDPSAAEDYDAFEPKLLKGVSGIWKEYVDAVFFIRLETILKTDEVMKARAVSDGTRIALTTMAPAHYAKNRFGLPPVMVFSLNFWDELQPYISGGIKQETAAEIKAEMDVLLLKVQDEATKKIIVETIAKAGDNTTQLNQLRARLCELTKSKGE